MSLDNLRLFDLVRYQRHELYQSGLINEDEYTELMTTNLGAVKRLEGYDVMRARLADVEAERDARGLKLATIEMRLMLCTGIAGWDEALSSALREREQLRAENAVLRKALNDALAALDDIGRPGSLTPWVNDICRDKAASIRAALAEVKP